MDYEGDFLDPSTWENGEFEWEAKSYYTVPLKCFMGKPSNLEEAVKQIRAEIATKGYDVPGESILLMEVGGFKGRLLLEIMRPQNYDASVTELERSKAFSTIHKGPLKTIKKTAKAFAEKVAQDRGVHPGSTYYWDFRHGAELYGARETVFVIFCRI